MLIEIFDDKPSLFHFFVGVLTFYFPFLLVVFFFYELLEFVYRYRKRHPEKLKCFIGDLIEYLTGVSFICLLYKLFFV